MVLRTLVRCLDMKGIKVVCREWCLKGFREITMSMRYEGLDGQLTLMDFQELTRSMRLKEEKLKKLTIFILQRIFKL